MSKENLQSQEEIQARNAIETQYSIFQTTITTLGAIGLIIDTIPDFSVDYWIPIVGGGLVLMALNLIIFKRREKLIKEQYTTKKQ